MKYKCWNCKEIVVVPDKRVGEYYNLPLHPGREFVFNFPIDVTVAEFDFVLDMLTQYREVMAVAPEIREAEKDTTSELAE